MYVRFWGKTTIGYAAAYRKAFCIKHRVKRDRKPARFLPLRKTNGEQGVAHLWAAGTFGGLSQLPASPSALTFPGAFRHAPLSTPMRSAALAPIWAAGPFRAFPQSPDSPSVLTVLTTPARFPFYNEALRRSHHHCLVSGAVCGTERGRKRSPGPFRRSGGAAHCLHITAKSPQSQANYRPNTPQKIEKTDVKKRLWRARPVHTMFGFPFLIHT